MNLKSVMPRRQTTEMRCIRECPIFLHLLTLVNNAIAGSLGALWNSFYMPIEDDSQWWIHSILMGYRVTNAITIIL